MNDKYILKGKRVVKCPDIHKWGEWFQKADRIVAKSSHNDITVSTVFLGLDHNFYRQMKPVLFETMIFGGEKDQYVIRYATWKQAEKGHYKACKLAWEFDEDWTKEK